MKVGKMKELYHFMSVQENKKNIQLYFVDYNIIWGVGVGNGENISYYLSSVSIYIKSLQY